MNGVNRRRGATSSPPISAPQSWLVTTRRRLLGGTADGRLHGRSLVIARTVWLALAGLTGTLYVAGTWTGLAHLRLLCNTGLCQHGQVSPTVRHALADLQLSVDFFNGYMLALDVFFTLCFAAIAVLIFWRSSQDPFALFVSLSLLLFGAAAFGNQLLPLLAEHPALLLPIEILGWLGTAAFGTFLYVFPDGRFVPRWTMLAALAWAVLFLPSYLVAESPLAFTAWTGLAYFGVWACLLSAFVFAQVYRYRFVSTPAQRVQTKWVVFGLVAASAGYFGGQLILALLGQPLTSARAVLATFVGRTLIYATLLLIPICIGIAMLRHHLFDIDLIIRQTLVYTTLVATLALLYECGVLVLVKLVIAFTGQESLAAEAVIAFGVGAAAEPLHRQIERFNTRLLYTRKYEAERRIEAFSKQVRRELGLTTATERFHETVGARLEETVGVRQAPARPASAPDPLRNGATRGQRTNQSVAWLTPMGRASTSVCGQSPHPISPPL